MSDRHNGLAAARYAVLRDVDPREVDGLLELLRDEGIAAFVEPSPGARGPYGDTVLPSRPTDRLHVDAERVQEAGSVVEAHLRAVDEELAWAGIVAGFDAPANEPVGRWPASEDISDDETATPGPPESGLESPREAIRPAPPEDPRAYSVQPYDEGHYEPPPPPPLPRTDTVGRFAWAGALGGPGLLFLSAAAGIDLAGWLGVGALLAFVAGFVTLVARMKDRPPTDSGPDNGAVV